MNGKLNIKKIAGKTNCWFLDVRVRVSGGSRLRKTETFTGTKSQAEDRFVDIRRQMKEEHQTVLSPKAEIKTIGEVLDVYKESRGEMLSNEVGRINRLKNELGGVLISDLPLKLDSYLNLLKASNSKIGKKYSNGSLNKLLVIIKASLNHAVQKELIERNPITNGRFPRFEETPRDTVLTESQIEKLFEAIKLRAPYLENIVRYNLHVPCRKSELLNMKREDLVLDEDQPYIRVRNGTTKNKRGVNKPIPPVMIEYFKNLPAESEYLFYRECGGQFLQIKDFKRAWTDCLKSAGISDFRFHDMRHIAATNLVNKGTPVRVVMAIAGWETDMLTDYYHRDPIKSLELVRFG